MIHSPLGTRVVFQQVYAIQCLSSGQNIRFLSTIMPRIFAESAVAQILSPNVRRAMSEFSQLIDIIDVFPPFILISQFSLDWFNVLRIICVSSLGWAGLLALISRLLSTASLNLSHFISSNIEGIKNMNRIDESTIPFGRPTLTFKCLLRYSLTLLRAACF